LAEDHVPGALVGETFFIILKEQFERLRDGDRVWSQRYLPRFWVRMVERRTLATIIRQNTGIGREIQDNVFLVDQGMLPRLFTMPSRPGDRLCSSLRCTSWRLVREHSPGLCAFALALRQPLQASRYDGSMRRSCHVACSRGAIMTVSTL
jgi:hypothetical protein